MSRKNFIKLEIQRQQDRMNYLLHTVGYAYINHGSENDFINRVSEYINEFRQIEKKIDQLSKQYDSEKD